MNYDRLTAAIYDEGRVPVGLDIIRRALGSLTTRPSQLRLLDAGCGGGVYAQRLAEAGLRISLMDISTAMLNVARERLDALIASKQVSLCRASLTALPYMDSSFDAVLVSQVLHHLEAGDDPGYAAHGRAIKEIGRVLKPGGMLVLNACTHEQLRSGFWYYALIPCALKRALAHGADDTDIVRFIEAAGMEVACRWVPVRDVLQGHHYFNPNGPLDPFWRSLDSIWSLTTEGEIRAAEAIIISLGRSGRLHQFFDQHDRLRTCKGQTTFFVAYKSPTGQGSAKP